MGAPKRAPGLRFNPISLLIALLLFSGCASRHPFPKWMLGEWRSSFDGIAIRECWEKQGATYHGSTVWSWDGKQRKETLALFYRNDTLIYRVHMEKKTLDFACQNPLKDTVVFVNRHNDFPKRLVYVRPKARNMTVWIDNEPGDPNRITFPFRKD